MILDGWEGNTTLGPSGLFTNQTTYIGSNQSNGVILSAYQDNTASITFPVNDSQIAFAFYLANSVFSPHNFQIPVTCVHPISGQYDVLTRGLFYLLLIFSLLFRRHTWLSTAALGTAMTYAATTAVHAFALVSKFGFGTPSEPSSYYDSPYNEWVPNQWNSNTSVDFGDLDIFGIYAVLSAAAIMLTPILNWSVTIRAHQAQAVVVYWGILIFTAMVPAWLRNNYIGRIWWQNTPLSFALCPYSASTPELHCGPKMELTTDNYNHCGCTDFCGVLSPSAPMRKGANMVAYVGRPVSILALDSQPLLNLYIFNQSVLGFIVIQGVFGLIESQFTQAEVRNYVFRGMYAEPRDFLLLALKGQRRNRVLDRLGMQKRSLKTSFRWKLQFQFARLVAAVFFVSAIMFAVVCPVVFITNLISTEFYLTSYPPSELSDAVGAWGSWTGAAFVLLAATVAQYHHAWIRSLGVVVQRAWLIVQYAEGEPERRPSHADGPEEERVRDRVKALFMEVSIPFVHAWYSLLHAHTTLVFTMQSFGNWLHDPIHLSVKPQSEVQAELKDLIEAKASCQCRQCQRDRAKANASGKSHVPCEPEASFGKRLVQGLENRYVENRAQQGDNESQASGEDFGLPRVTTSPSLSIALGRIGQSSTAARTAQARPAFRRQDTDSAHEPFRVSRRPVGGTVAPGPQAGLSQVPVSDRQHSTEEEEALLTGAGDTV